MKKFAAIYLGKRWARDRAWGVLVEGARPALKLLCVGCTQGQAEQMVEKLNRPSVKAAVALLLAMVMFSGCGFAPLKGGKASTVSKSSQGIEQTVVQSDNPAQMSRQDQETIRTKSYTVPAGSRLVSASNQVLVVSAPMPVVEHEETRAKTELGAAQKDTARELSAKLASLKGIVWVGVVVFLFGLASIFYPPLKLIIGSVTTSAAIAVGGLALMVLPTVIVGNELLILGGVAAAVGLWFLAHRHGQLRGLVDAVNTPKNQGLPGKTPDNS
jgi:hypothetical protein